MYNWFLSQQPVGRGTSYSLKRKKLKVCRVVQNLPQKAEERRQALCQSGGGGCSPNSVEPKRCLKAACVDPRPLPPLQAGHCCPGDLAFHSHPGRERGNWSSQASIWLPHLKADPTSEGSCPSSDTLRLADSKALTQSARHQWPQKAEMLGEHLSQESQSTSTPARLPLLPGVRS